MYNRSIKYADSALHKSYQNNKPCQCLKLHCLTAVFVAVSHWMHRASCKSKQVINLAEAAEKLAACICLPMLSNDFLHFVAVQVCDNSIYPASCLTAVRCLLVIGRLVWPVYRCQAWYFALAGGVLCILFVHNTAELGDRTSLYHVCVVDIRSFLEKWTLQRHLG